MAEQCGLGRRGLRVALQRVGNRGVQLAPLGAEQAVVGGVLDQGVLEAVGGLGAFATAEQQAGGNQLLETLVELSVRQAGDRRRAACGRSRGRSRRRPARPAGPPACGRGGPAARLAMSRERRRAGAAGPACGAASITAWVNSSMNSGTPSDCATIRSSRLSCSARRLAMMAGERRRLLALQPAQRHRGDAGMAHPGCLELRPEGHHQQHAKPAPSAGSGGPAARACSGPPSACPQPASAPGRRRSAARPGAAGRQTSAPCVAAGSG